MELAGGSRLADHLHEGRGLLLDLAGEPKLAERAAPWAGRVPLLSVRSPGRPGLAALLVRPDGYVA